MYSYTDLDAYNISLDLVVSIYKATENFPKQEIYGLCSQMRRCAVSIPSNIAEGSGRHSTKEFIQFLYISNGSLSELETQIRISQKLGLISETEELFRSIKRIRVMVLGLIKTLNNKVKES